ncbi:MAG: cyclic 2,3-diphosphoglycerate synthase [Candidatus Neomarinimicrobiota bacterium]|jgi:predicted GTPase|nr:cyclic 2,3-diphosphoglycerate synthase [Candidatus Neomarinimicrobiota bacterium]MDD3966785.1 cyclic 2,3-diphosphoglycerate synthase [Candidatus Neomarinimicrobiota bacterium]MDX9779600.1 cyclic 2,3-diphosphoglycerate synthase [bacterium]
MERTKVIIMGAAGRDFHNFNTFFRGNPAYEVLAFTATQIPDIDGRKYPAELAGELYPEGIMIYDESQLPELIRRYDADQVVFSYSDVPHEVVMHKAALANACGADFLLMGGKRTMLKSSKPVIAINAVRTGCGKSQTTRRVVNILREMGLRVVSVRHPMPYGNLAEQAVQRFASLADLKKHKCTIEEMEEYEPHIAMGSVIYSGVDYEAILREAEKEADIILWDGGNNDTSFFKADLIITVADPHRPGHETNYYPGETNLRMADIVIINKIDTADNADIESVRENIRKVNPKAHIVDAASPIFVEDPESIRGKRVLVIEDGPTLTHGEMEYGAGTVAAVKFGAKELVDPRPYTVGTISKTFEKYPDIGILLPAMGYGEQQMKDLEKTVAKTDCDAVVIGTPIDLRRVIRLDKPSVRVSYELQEIGKPDLKMLLEILLPKIGKKA